MYALKTKISRYFDDELAGVNREAELTDAVAELRVVRAKLNEKPKPERVPLPAGMRPYTVTEAVEKFGQADAEITYVGAEKLYGIDCYGCHRELEPRELRVDGVVVRGGYAQLRVYADDMPHACEFAYVRTDELLANFCWPDGKPCGELD